MLKAMDPAVDREDAFVGVPVDRKIRGDCGRGTVRDLSAREGEFSQHMMPTEFLLNPTG